MLDNTKKHILIVDDEEEITALLKTFFELKGFSVAVMEDGITALNYISEILPDLVVTDLLLPGEHGIDVIKTIKKKYFIPVIIITGIYQVFYLFNKFFGNFKYYMLVFFFHGCRVVLTWFSFAILHLFTGLHLSNL